MMATQSASRALLDIADLHLAIGDQPILRGVSLSVPPGRVVGLVGESGAGKTMLGRVVLGIQPHNSRITGGKVVFDERDITHLDEHERRHLLGREIALVPQNPMTALNPVARIEPQITDVLRLHMQLDRKARTLACHRAVAIGAPARAGAPAAPVSARALRRHAPARADRHRVRLQAAA